MKTAKFESWAKSIALELKKNNNKRIVLIGGASASGKTYNCKQLSKYLEEQGFSCIQLSSDDYYKSVIEILVEEKENNQQIIYKITLFYTVIAS